MLNFDAIIIGTGQSGPANLLDHDQRRVSDRITAYALYTDPHSAAPA